MQCYSLRQRSLSIKVLSSGLHVQSTIGNKWLAGSVSAIAPARLPHHHRAVFVGCAVLCNLVQAAQVRLCLTCWHASLSEQSKQILSKGTRVSTTACCMLPPMQQEDAQFGRRRCIVCLGMQVYVAAAQARNPGPNHREGGPTDCGLLPHILRHLPCLCTVLLHGAIALEIFEPIRHARL